MNVAFCFFGETDVPDLGFSGLLEVEDLGLGVLGFEERRGREVGAEGEWIVAGAERGLTDAGGVGVAIMLVMVSSMLER